MSTVTYLSTSSPIPDADSYSLDEAQDFYTQQKQEISSLISCVSELEADVKVPFDEEDTLLYNKLIYRARDIRDEIRWVERQVSLHSNEEMNPENISFKGLYRDLQDAVNIMMTLLKNQDGTPQYHFDTVFYHKDCLDGQCAVWVYRRKMKELNIAEDKVSFIPMIAGKFPTDVDIKGKRILMVDVCPKKNEIEDIVTKCEYLYILDHHESGHTDVKDVKLMDSEFTDGYHKNLHVIFDMKRCGAQIAWDYFYPDNYSRLLIEKKFHSFDEYLCVTHTDESGLSINGF